MFGFSGRSNETKKFKALREELWEAEVADWKIPACSFTTVIVFFFDDTGQQHLDLRNLPSGCNGNQSLDLAHNCLGMSLSEVQQICFHRDIARWTASSQVMSSANLSNDMQWFKKMFFYVFLFPSIPQLYKPSGSKLRWRVRRRRRCEIGEHIGCQPSITMSCRSNVAWLRHVLLTPVLRLRQDVSISGQLKSER